MSDPEPLMKGFKIYGYETQVVEVSRLYPITGEARTQEGVILGDVPFALWSPSERSTEQGEYEDYAGEADTSSAEILRRNVSLYVGDPVTRYRVMLVTVNISPPRVTFTARRAGG